MVPLDFQSKTLQAANMDAQPQLCPITEHGLKEAKRCPLCNAEKRRFAARKHYYKKNPGAVRRAVINAAGDGGLPKRFWDKVNRSNTCWVWTGSKTSSGYGRFSVGRLSKRAHRIVYVAFVGPIGNGLVLDHLCRNRACVNPGHLEPVTTLVNGLRGNNLTNALRAKTHCKRGHVFDEENTIIEKKGGRGRSCRKCANARSSAYHIARRKRRAEAKLPSGY